jgi:hypothetical protein
MASRDRRLPKSLSGTSKDAHVGDRGYDPQCSVLMDQFKMDRFNDTPLSPLDEHPVCPTCGGVLAHLQTVSSDSVPLPFYFEFSLFHCATDGLFYRTRPGTDDRANESGVRVPCKRPSAPNEEAVALPEPD